MSDERRRALARALHEPPINPRFKTLHVSIAHFRDRAAALYAKLIQIEAANDDNFIAPLRRALIACSEQVEGIARMVGAPMDVCVPIAQEWIDQPTFPRRTR